MFSALIFVVLCALCSQSTSASPVYTSEDVYVPANCNKIASPGDHLLLEYSVLFANGTIGAHVKRPNQLYHVHLESSDSLPVHAGLKGMCENATRKLTWPDPATLNLEPIFVADARMAELDEDVSIVVTVVHITSSEDYQIFDALTTRNLSLALELIEQHKGINAFDEWGQTPLIMAVSHQYIDVVSALLNTRMPKVDVNLAKSSGFTALFYAVEKATPSILGALLRKGADPNAAILQEGSKGNTPLHFACLFEKTKHMELLLEYGANPMAVNQHGQSPLQLLPADSVRSTKLYFKKSFEDAYNKIRAAAAASLTASASTSNNEL